MHLRVFKGKRRIAAYLGNLYYDALEWDKALAIYQRLINGQFGELSEPELAYCVYLVGNIHHMAGRKKEAMKAFEAFEGKRFATTPIAARAIYSRAQIATQYERRDGVYEKIATENFLRLLREYPDFSDNDITLVALGYALLRQDRKDEAKQCFHEYLKRYPGGGYTTIVQETLEEKF